MMSTGWESLKLQKTPNKVNIFTQSHVLLTHLLWPRLKSAGEQKEKGKVARAARIVNVSSCAHFAGFCIDFDDLQCR